MEKLKKVLSITLVVLMLAVGMSACGKDDPDGIDSKGATTTESGSDKSDDIKMPTKEPTTEATEPTTNADEDEVDDGKDLEKVSKNWQYESNGKGTVKVTKYKGSAFKVTIPKKIGGKKVTEVGKNTFKDNKNNNKLKNVTVPNGVKSIEKHAFFDCKTLESISIPNSVRSIGEDAFAGCVKLKSVTVPSSVQTIGKSAFLGCRSLSTVKLSDGLTAIGESAFQSCEALTSITIPGSVKTISSNAFYDCGKLKSVKMSEGVVKIGNEVFSGCTSLTEITLPSSLRGMGNSVFSYCDSLKTINVNSGNANYSSKGGVLFNKKQTVLIKYPCGIKDKSYTVPDGVKTIAENAFQNCKSIVTVKLPNSLTDLNGDSFVDCEGLKNIDFPDNLMYIGCNSLDNSSWYQNQPDGIVYAGKVLYKYKGEMPKNTKITVKDGTLSISEEAFYNCGNLVSVAIPNSVKKIGWGAFSGCNGLKSITVPGSVTTIEEHAFAFCRNVTSITVSDGVNSIAEEAFLGCNNLKNMTIAASVTSFGKQSVGYGFDYKYYEGNEEDPTFKLTSFSISGYKGSAAEKYATDNGFKFKDLNAK